MMSIEVNLNADMAEGFGAYDIGNDEAILKVIDSANVACGFHAGDPSVMRRVVRQAKQLGVSVGAHPGFNDLWGFGRRQIQMRADDLENMVAYQLGALQAIATAEGTHVTHLKPHGALNNMAAVDSTYAGAIAKAIKAVDASIIYVALSGSEMERAARDFGLRIALEGFCDRQYDDDGNLTSRKLPGSVLSSADAAVDQVLNMVLRKKIVSRNGVEIPCEVHTLCVHGDEPTAVKVATAVREALVKSGVSLKPINALNI